MEKIKLTFSGDIILEPDIINLYKKEKDSYDFNSMFTEEIKNFLSSSDYVIGNLETPISSFKEDLKTKPYTFTSPIEFAQAVKYAGFDFVTTANNHCLDNGIDGIKKTLDSLDTVGLDNTGVSYGEEKLKIININGIKVALLSYTYGTNAFSNHVYLDKNEKKVKVNLFQEQELSNTFVRNLYQGNNIVIKVLRKIFKFLGAFQLNKMVYERIESSKEQKEEIIKKINNCKKNGADCIIMCMHEGGQYNEKPIEKTKKTAKFLIKNGVNLVIGNHEHVVHNVEFVDDHFITYSLGNFIDTVGVLKDPFGKMSEYSILVNIYISKNDNKINYDKFTFTITKTVIDKRPNGNGVKVELLYDLIKKCNDKEERLKLLKDNQKIVGIVTKKIIDINNVKKEYELN